MMNILITGASGFIGKRLMQELADKKDVKVYALSRHEIDDKSVELLQGDLLDKEFIDECFERCSFDVVFHLAGITEHHRIVDEKIQTLEDTLAGAGNLLRAFNHYCKDAVFLFSSTGKVYGKTNEMPISESAYVNPQNILGKIKRMTEELIDIYAVPQNRYIICRIFNVYGEFQRRSFVLPTIIDQIEKQELILGNLNDLRDYLYVDDLVSALIACAKQAKQFSSVDYVNIGSGAPADVSKLVDIISELTGKRFSIFIDGERLRGDETPVEYCNNEKINHLTGWYPQYTLKEGLRKTLKSEGIL